MNAHRRRLAAAALAGTMCLAPGCVVVESTLGGAAVGAYSVASGVHDGGECAAIAVLAGATLGAVAGFIQGIVAFSIEADTPLWWWRLTHGDADPADGACPDPACPTH